MALDWSSEAKDMDNPSHQPRQQQRLLLPTAQQHSTTGSHQPSWCTPMVPPVDGQPLPADLTQLNWVEKGW